jgi:hypothetical protein
VKKYLLMDVLGGVLRGMNEPLIKAMVIALSPQDMLGAGAAVFTVVSELGRGVGPTLVRKGEREREGESKGRWR